MTEAELGRTDDTIPVDTLAGTRYAATLVALPDGERGPWSSARHVPDEPNSDAKVPEAEHAGCPRSLAVGQVVR
nr:hypothetical protein OG461_06540 [Streptomyces sp. NBC_00995]